MAARSLLVVVLLWAALCSACDPFKEPNTCGPWGKGVTTESCCKGKDADKCRAYLYTGTEMRRCFGASGDDCNGIPQLAKGSKIIEALGKAWNSKVLQRLAASIVVKKNEDGSMMVPTSVGSIYHDTCCVAHPDGVFCNKYNQPFTSILRKKTNKCHCSMEWRKAVMSLLTGRWWYTHLSATHVSDHTPLNRPLPTTNLPVSLSRWDKAASSYNLKMVKATSELRAPPGTRLDCPGTDNRCLVGFLKFNKVEDDSAPAAELCAKYNIQLSPEVHQRLVLADQAQDSLTKQKQGLFRRILSKIKGVWQKLWNFVQLSEETADIDRTVVPGGLVPPSMRRERHGMESAPSELKDEPDPLGAFGDHASGSPAWSAIMTSSDWKLLTADVSALPGSTNDPQHLTASRRTRAADPVQKLKGYDAGDSHFCASGKFKSIHFRLHLVRGFRRFGVCA